MEKKQKLRCTFFKMGTDSESFTISKKDLKIAVGVCWRQDRTRESKGVCISIFLDEAANNRIDTSVVKCYNNHGFLRYFGLLGRSSIVLNGYMTVKEAAAKWGISERTVQVHCKKGRIPGVARVGRSWIIPDGTMKPTYVFVCLNENDAVELHDNKA